MSQLAINAVTAAPPRPVTSGVSVRFVVRDGGTVLDHLYQAAPCRVFFPDFDKGDTTLAVLVNTAGGLLGGDHVDSKIALGASTRVTVTTQAAEKVYRSLGADCVVANHVTVDSDALLEWAPQETILFEGARLDRRLDIRLATDARMLAAEMIFFGRRAHGELLNQGHFRDSWTVRIGGRLIWSDAVLLSGDIAGSRQRPFGFGDAAGYATIVLAAADAAAKLDNIRTITAESGAEHAGCSQVNGLVILRFMDRDAARLRAAVARSLVLLRQDCFGLPDRLPRPWAT